MTEQRQLFQRDGPPFVPPKDCVIGRKFVPMKEGEFVPDCFIYCDGGNKESHIKPAGGRTVFSAVVIDADTGQELGRERQTGKGTNNVAEYEAVKLGAALARRLGVLAPVFRTDSLLVVNQLCGAWSCANPRLRVLREKTRAFLRGIGGQYRVEHIGRRKNIAHVD